MVEYGSGSSTKFFNEKLNEQDEKWNYVAVERDPEWFDKIREDFNAEIVERHPWGLTGIIKYYLTPQPI